MTEDDCEALALEVSRESGLDDRPDADPCVIAVAWAGLRLRPEVGAQAHLANGTVVYPASAAPSAVAYYVGHELGHDIIEWSGERMCRELEEQAASRIACALILPGPALRRDLRAHSDLVHVLSLWPLASPWVLARRVCELTGASASMYGPSGRVLRHVGPRRAAHARAISLGGCLISFVD